MIIFIASPVVNRQARSHLSSFSLNAIPSEIPPQQSKSVPTLTKFLILLHGSLWLVYLCHYLFFVCLQPFEVREDKNIASFVFFLAAPTSNESIVGTK